MKGVIKERYLLCVLKNANAKLRKAILQNCDDCVIQTLSEIVHNVISGNIPIDEKTLNGLKKYKSKLRSIHSNIRKKKLNKDRRKIFVNQVGGFAPILPLLLKGVLSAALSYGGQKLIEYGASKFAK